MLGTVGLERPLPACRASQFLIHAATEATQMARLPEAVAAGGRVGVVIGSALGGIAEAERWHDQPRDLHALAGASYDGPTRQLARWLDARGPVLTISTACASGATSLGLAADLLRAGTATAVVAGGMDVLCRFVMRGFNHLRSLTRDEVRAILAGMRGVPGLCAALLYGAGLRLMECLELRVKDLDFTRGEIVVRDGKGGKDRLWAAAHNRSYVPGKVMCRESHSDFKRRRQLRSVARVALRGDCT